MLVRAGQPFPMTPRARVTDARGFPLSGKKVVVFLNEHYDFYRPWKRQGEGYAEHHLRGQNYGLLSHASVVSDSNGEVSFSDIRVVAAASKFLFFFFYCDGIVSSWNYPEMAPPSEGQPIRPPAYIPPVYIHEPELTVVEQVGSDGAPMVCEEDVANCDQFDTGCKLNALLRTPSVIEGESLNGTINIRVRVGRMVGGSFMPQGAACCPSEILAAARSFHLGRSRRHTSLPTQPRHTHIHRYSTLAQHSHTR
jgi:hypothetical protein